jgi:hypothetical protein
MTALWDIVPCSLVEVVYFNELDFRKQGVSFILVGWAHKATLTPRPFLVYCVSPSDFIISSDSARVFYELAAEIYGSEAEETW